MSEWQALVVPNLPPANPSYSQIVRLGGLLLISGQIGLDPATGKLVGGGVGPETERTLQNLRLALEAAGATARDVGKVTVYLTDMEQWGAMNEAYMRFFLPPAPAKTTVEVRRLSLGASVEIEAMAQAPVQQPRR